VLAQPREVARLVSGPVEATGAGTGLLAPADVPTPQGIVRLAAPATVEAYAHGLYRALREADALGLRLVVAVPPPASGLGAAVTDRLTRAVASGGRRGA
jgi:L-threonylcarbamoyladenylate synthase